MIRQWILLLVLIPAQNASSSLEGTVVRLGTNEPIQDARVLLVKASGDDSPNAEFMTGRDGRFTFKDLHAGSYRLLVASNGYVRQEFGQRAIELTEGQATKGLVVRMTPTGTINGRVQDSENNPISGISVELMRYSYDENGKRTLRAFGEARTNDLGEYRIYFITPGTYYLRVAASRAVYGRNQLQDSYIPLFYPSTADPRNASLIEISAGMERRGIDLTLQRQNKPFTIRGRVADSSTGKPTENISGLYLTRTDLAGDLNETSNPLYQNGTFEFRNIAPGKYLLWALAYEPTAGYRYGQVPLRREGEVAVEVVDSNVDGIQVTLQPGFTISGQIRQDDGKNPEGLLFWNISTGGPPQGATLTPISESRASRMRPDFSNLNEDGTFQVVNLTPGEYLFSIDWLKDQYVKQATFGGMDILNRPLRFTGSESGKLEIVLSPKMGTIEGKVVDQQLEARGGAQVVLVPDRRERTTLFRPVTTDSKGQFSITKVAPGDYKLFAWEALEPYQYFDPEVLRRSDSRAMPLHVGELSKQTVNVTVLPEP